MSIVFLFFLPVVLIAGYAAFHPRSHRRAVHQEATHFAETQAVGIERVRAASKTMQSIPQSGETDGERRERMDLEVDVRARRVPHG